MKRPIKLLSVLFVATIFVVSCQKDEPVDLPQETTNQSIDWETVDPEIIKSINKEIDLKAKNGLSKAPQLYRNFRLEIDSNTPSDVVALIKKEIDQMYSNLELKRSTIAKMDDVPVIYLAPTTSRGMYYDGRVVINDYNLFRRVKQSKSSVVFHELTHYYHDVHLPNGDNNATVRSLHSSAKSRRIYPSSAYVLSNRFEYLATSSEAYYSGTSRDPFNKANVSQKDPGLKTFLNANF
jgi:hypothetical protein